MPTTAEAQRSSGIARRRLPWSDAVYAAAGLTAIAGAVVLTGRFEPLRVGVRPFSNWIEPFQLQSFIALCGACLLFWLSRLASSRARTLYGAACIAAIVAAMIVLPLHQPIRMGDSGTYTSSRQNFDFYMGGRTVRFEAHLSSMLLRGLDEVMGASETSPREAFTWLMRAAAVWYGAMLLLVGWAGRWSPSTLRYQSLVVGAPATLMYFGYRELGYLSLNAAVVPLVFLGFRGRRRSFDLGCAAAGLGAALHGFGLLALAGTALAALGARLRVADRARLLVHAFAFGTSVYLIWLFAYVTVLRLDIVPGHAESIPWRPLFDNTTGEGRINYAIASARGATDVLLSGWITGLPLAVLALVALRRRADIAVPVLLFSLPSALFLCAFWPVQGLAVEADLLFAAFPAFFAVAWMASRTARATFWSLLFLASAHVVFWRVMLSDLFVNSRIY